MTDRPDPSATLLADALPLLRAPFPPGVVRWKVQRVLAGGCPVQVVPYLEVTAVYERLNAGAGAGWATPFEIVEPARPATGPGRDRAPRLFRVACRLTI